MSLKKKGEVKKYHVNENKIYKVSKRINHDST